MVPARASEIFRGCLPQSSMKNLCQMLAPLAISGQFERFSPGPNGSEVGRQITLNSLTGHPTSVPFCPGENLSKWPEIARAARICPKLFSGDWGRHPRKFSLALLHSACCLYLPSVYLWLNGDQRIHSKDLFLSCRFAASGVAATAFGQVAIHANYVN